MTTVLRKTAAFDPERFRPDFPILARTVHDGVPLVYLDNAATSQRPRQVIQAIVDAYEQHYANVHRGIHTLSEEIDELYEGAREKVRAFINAPSEPPEGDSPATTEQVIFTSGTTHSINLVARSWGDANLRAGDEILLTEMEHHSNLVPWYQLAERTGAVVRHIPLTDDGRLQLDALDTLLTKRTKLVSVTAVSNVLGTINPIAEIIGRAHDVGAIVLVDGAQSVPHMKIDVLALDCRLPGLQRAQDARPLGRRRALRETGTAGSDAAVPRRRRNDQGSDARRVSGRCFCRASSRPARRRLCRPWRWERPSIISTPSG